MQLSAKPIHKYSQEIVAELAKGYEQVEFSTYQQIVKQSQNSDSDENLVSKRKTKKLKWKFYDVQRFDTSKKQRLYIPNV